ncbi:MAG: hypothetical protein AAB550_03135 [Patescibacteria group bacterium]
MRLIKIFVWILVLGFVVYLIYGSISSRIVVRKNDSVSEVSTKITSIKKANPNIEILLDTSNLPVNWESSLQLILARSKITGKTIKVVDLRFNPASIIYE